jgi:hypothetical protein
MENISEEELLKELKTLQKEHSDLNNVICNIENVNVFTKNGPDHLTIQRLKKRKLWIKDRIIFIKSIIHPNIIA